MPHMCVLENLSPREHLSFVDAPLLPCFMLLYDHDWQIDIIKTHNSTQSEAARLANQA